MSVPAPRALIVTPYALPSFSDELPVQTAVHRTRLYNFMEFLRSSDQRWETTIDLEADKGIKLLVLVGRRNCTTHYLGDQLKAEIAKYKGFKPVSLNWDDIDDIDGTNSPKLPELRSSPWPPAEWQEIADTPTTGPTRLTEQLGELAVGLAGIDFGEQDRRAAVESAVRGATSSGQSPTPSAAADNRSIPVSVLSRGASFRKLLVREGTIGEVPLNAVDSPSELKVVLSSEGDAAAAWQSGEILLWQDGSPEVERLPGLAAASGLEEESMRVLAIRSPWPQVISLLVADPKSAAIVTMGPSGQWALHSRWDARESVAGAFLAGGTLTLSDKGVPSGHVTHEEGVEFPAVTEGVDVLSTSSHDAVAIWGKTDEGDRIGLVYGRVALDSAKWQKLLQADDIRAVSLVRPRPFGVSPDNGQHANVALVLETEAGGRHEPTVLSLGR